MDGKTLSLEHFTISDNLTLIPMKLLIYILGLIVMWGCEIRPLDPETGKAIIDEASTAFDVDSFVEDIWDTRVLPLFQQENTTLTDLLVELRANQDVASRAHGHQEGNRPYNFIVKGEGTVVAVDTTSRAGQLTLLLKNQTEVQLQTGPVLRGTALRDALPFITFDQFVNQLEYAQVSNALHKQLNTSVLSEQNFGALLNKKILFSGVFTLNDPGTILITPVEIAEVTAE